MNELSLFTGAGGGLLGTHLLGWRPVCAVEIEPYCREVLLRRQRDGVLPLFPIWDDVRTFNGRPWRGLVDVVTGGFPCQDVSIAGFGAGLSGKRSGLWNEMARIIGEVQPRFVFVENSPMLIVRGLGGVLGDLATMGFDARWGVLGARHCGGPVERERIWIAGANESNGASRVGYLKEWPGAVFKIRSGECPEFWKEAPPISFGMEHGVDSYVDQVSAIGNGQVPAVVAFAWRTLKP